MNEQLISYYNKAIKRTKEMAYQDIFHYFETKEALPTFEQYLRERRQYLEQIWLNAWLNSTVSHVSYSEKKSYLSVKGYEVEGISKKIINQMFRNELREVKPFDLFNWLDEEFVNEQQKWNEKYKEARESYIAQHKANKQRELERSFYLSFQNTIEQIVKDKYEELYLYVRFLLGSRLAIEIEQKGILLPSEWITFSEYLDEEFVFSERNYRYSRHLSEKYESIITNDIIDFGPNWLKEQLPNHIFSEYKTTFHHDLSDHILKQYSFDLLVDVSLELFDDLLEEYVQDLIKLIDIPFEIETHKQILITDQNERERKELEEQEAIIRQKEAEAKMIEDIFGREYSPPAGRNIQYVLHVGETNTGKTYQAIKRMKSANSGIYLAPLRLLALEIYESLNEDGIPCSLKTGEEEKIIENASHLSCTVEMFREKDYYDIIVIDEAQMLADRTRGFSWYRAITKANAKEVHIICSFNAKQMILELLGESHIEVHEYVRETPLEVESATFKLGHTRKGDALVCFSRKRVLETASELQRNGKQVSMIYGSMPPETRKKQMQRFINGETTVIVATDAIGMGLNLPIRRIVFLENDKFDGTKRRFLSSQEVKQIAGRAGRKGIYNIGKVAFTNHHKMMTRLLQQEDEPLQGFAIAPTTSVLDRFQKYSRKLGLFFYLWDKYKNPYGTKKASLSEEKLLYEMIEDSIIEAKLSVHELYNFLHLPFSSNEPTLREQWKQKLEAIVEGTELPDPIIKESGLEELELSYKSVGLHLLFLYKLEKRTEAHYWERIREELSDKIHEKLKSGVEVKKRTCIDCHNPLPRRFKFQICDECHSQKRTSKQNGKELKSYVQDQNRMSLKGKNKRK